MKNKRMFEQPASGRLTVLNSQKTVFVRLNGKFHIAHWDGIKAGQLCEEKMDDSAFFVFFVDYEDVCQDCLSDYRTQNIIQAAPPKLYASV
jgi:hypothetical protein